jgi:hypothetical protein
MWLRSRAARPTRRHRPRQAGRRLTAYHAATEVSLCRRQ